MRVSYAIVYASESKMIRRIIANDDGFVYLANDPLGRPAVVSIEQKVDTRAWSLTSSLVRPTFIHCGYHDLLPGESALIVSKERHEPAHDFWDWCRIIDDHFGIFPPQIVCVHPDGALVLADPDVDGLPLVEERSIPLSMPLAA